MTEQEEFGRWLAESMAAGKDRSDAIENAHIHLQNTGLLPKVTLHKYMCSRGCPICTVFRIGGLTLCAVRDYKLSPGLNEQVSVPRAREKNTLDGKRHWPSHVFDLADQTVIQVNCRHFRGILVTDDILEAVRGVAPGRPRRPTRLGGHAVS